MKKPIAAIAAGCIALLATELFGLHALAWLEARLGDQFVRWQAASLVADPSIVVVVIDEASLARMHEVAGSWPWPRAVHAELVSGLAKRAPKAIVFDILFAEPDVYRPESDAAFNEAMAGATNVYLPIARLDHGGDAAGVELRDVAAALGIERGAGAREDARAALLLPRAVDPKFWRAGSIDFAKDGDGIGRRYALFHDIYGWRMPSLPARLARDFGWTQPPTQSMLLAWRGGSPAYQHVSYADLFDDVGLAQSKRPPDELRDKIVIIGTSATGLHDLLATPIHANYSGVEVLATAIDNLKNQRVMQRLPVWWMFLLGAGLIAALAFAVSRGVHTLGAGASLIVVSVAVLGAAYWSVGRLVLAGVLTPLLFVWVAYLAFALAEYLRERASRQHTERLFGRFLDPRVVSDLVRQGETEQSLTGKECQITVLFSDIRGFTTLAESKSPLEVVRLLNRYFSLQTEVVFRHGGTLDKYIGDAIMAFWGAPNPDAHHAQHAIAAAFEMEQCLQDFKRELGPAGDGFDVGIGVHSGRAVVGFIGSERRLDYTAIGDTVNLASRIEGLTKGVARILVSRDCANLATDAFTFRSCGSFAVKGRAQEVELLAPERKST